MATPPTADRLVAALKAEGLTVIEYKSWRTHNRNHKGAWGPLNGVMLHHTASSGEISSVDLCYNGYTGLPGPLCQSVIAKSGRVYMTGHGRCNHAGGGDPNVLQAVIDERYNDRPPVPRVGNASGIDGNARFIGAECINMGDGKDPWPAAQVDAMVRWSAAICRLMGWTAKSTIAHREWSSDKPDPAGPGMPPMPDMRAKIAERLAHSPSWSPGAPTPPTTGTDMPDDLVLGFHTANTLTENNPEAIYWEDEYVDTASSHGAGGKTVLTGRRYTGTVQLQISGLGEGEFIEVYAAEENTSGTVTGQAVPVTVYGEHEGSHTLRPSIPLTGKVGERLVVYVVSRTVNTVTLESGRLQFLTWAN
jgi:hypothetical protein